MSWKSEIDRTVHEAARRAFDERRTELARAVTLVNEFVALNPGRAQSHFALGLVEEAMHLRTLPRTGRHGAFGAHGGRAAAHGEDGQGVQGSGAAGSEGPSSIADPDAAGVAAPPTEAAPARSERASAGDDVVVGSSDAGAAGDSAAGADEGDDRASTAANAPIPPLAESATGDASLWRWLGRVDVASRGGPRARVRELASDPAMDLAVERGSEGRMALRAVSRALLFGGDDARVYDLYLRHITATADEGSKRDADGLAGDAARHADDLAHDGDEPGSTAAILRALDFVRKAGLEGRAAAKLQRKLGRSHQLAGRFAEAAQGYRDALASLAPDDRYRSVLHGDLALAALEVRGTLDLLPKEGRGNVSEAERLLADAKGDGEGESYNAIYTLGVLAYERGDWAGAAERFREADRLMSETRAKARIVHARARFFLGACILRMAGPDASGGGLADEALREAEHYITRDAAAAALDASVKEPIFDLLATAHPTARIPGRLQPRDTAMHGDGGDRGPRDDRGRRGRRGGRGRGRGGRGAFGEGPEAIVSGGSFDGFEVTPGAPAADDSGAPASGPEGSYGENDGGPMAAAAGGADVGHEERRPRGARGGRGRGRERGGDRGSDRPGAAERMDRYAGRGGAGRADRPPREPHYHGGSHEVRPAPFSHAGAASPAGDVSGATPPTLAGTQLATARRVLDADPHGALKAVDDAFKSRPTFEEWHTAYRIRLEALIRLHEQSEALRTYERFRAKLYERERADRLEELLIDPSGPMSEVLDEAGMQAELVDLYAAMPGRERQFVEAATGLASHCASLGTPTDLRKAVSLLREAIALGGEEARGLWTDVATRARAGGVSVDGPAPDAVAARLLSRGSPARVVVVGGDDSSRGHGPRVEDVGRRVGFEGSLVLGGARPPAHTLADVESRAKGAAAIVLLHTATRDVRDGVKRIGGDLSVPVREIPYAGAASLEPELLVELGTI